MKLDINIHIHLHGSEEKTLDAIRVLGEQIMSALTDVVARITLAVAAEIKAIADDLPDSTETASAVDKLNAQAVILEQSAASLSSGKLPPAPSIASLSPASAAPGTGLTISGTNFGSAPGNVSMNGVPVNTDSWSADGTSITLTVPAGTTSGPVIVTTSAGHASPGVNFTVL